MEDLAIPPLPSLSAEPVKETYLSQEVSLAPPVCTLPGTCKGEISITNTTNRTQLSTLQVQTQIHHPSQELTSAEARGFNLGVLDPPSVLNTVSALFYTYLC